MDRGLHHRHGGLDIFELLRRCDPPVCQLALPFDFRLSALELGAIAFKIGFAQGEQRPRVLLEEGLLARLCSGVAALSGGDLDWTTIGESVRRIYEEVIDQHGVRVS